MPMRTKQQNRERTIRLMPMKPTHPNYGSLRQIEALQTAGVPNAESWDAAKNQHHSELQECRHDCLSTSRATTAPQQPQLQAIAPQHECNEQLAQWQAGTPRRTQAGAEMNDRAMKCSFDDANRPTTLRKIVLFMMNSRAIDCPHSDHDGRMGR